MKYQSSIRNTTTTNPIIQIVISNWNINIHRRKQNVKLMKNLPSRKIRVRKFITTSSKIKIKRLLSRLDPQELVKRYQPQKMVFVIFYLVIAKNSFLRVLPYLLTKTWDIFPEPSKKKCPHGYVRFTIYSIILLHPKKSQNLLKKK